VILLDTNAAIAIITGRPPAVRHRNAVALASGESVAISAVVAFELWFGALHSSQRERNSASLRRFLSSLHDILPFDAEDAATAAEIRSHLAASGKPIGPYDLLIAAQALRRGALLITANPAEFARVPHLRCQDWSANK